MKHPIAFTPVLLNIDAGTSEHKGHTPLNKELIPLPPETESPRPPEISARPVSIRRMLISVLIAAVSPALIAVAYIQVTHIREVRAAEVLRVSGGAVETAPADAPFRPDVSFGVGLILLGAALSAGVAVRSGRVILKDNSGLRDSMAQWSTSSTPGSRPPMPRTVEIREVAAHLYDIAMERDRLREIVHGSERGWMELAEGLPHLVWTCVPEGACDFLSKQWVFHTGMDKSEHLGDRWLENLHPEDRDVIVERWKQAVETGTLFDAEFRIRRHDGTYRWFKSRAVPVHDGSGKIYKWYAAGEDIHKLRELQAALYESGERFRLALENIPDGVVIYNPELTIQYVNEALTAISGRGAGDFIGRRDEEIWPPEVYSTYLPVLVQARETRSVRSVDVDVTANGRRFYTRIRFLPLLADGDQLKEIITVIQDMTEWKQTEQALQEKRVELEIAGRVAAEKELLLNEEKVRALTAELMVAEEQARRKIAIELHDRIGQNLAISKIKLCMALKAARSAGLARELTEIRDFLDQTIDDTRSLSYELSPPSLQDGGLNRALQDLVDYVQSGHRTTIDYTWQCPIERFERSAEVIVYMAVRELLFNIVKHADSTRGSITVAAGSDELRITVEDNGVCSNLVNLQAKGRAKGFGLATMRDRLANLSGTFNIDSCSGDGTRAVIVLPLDAINPQEAQPT